MKQLFITSLILVHSAFPTIEKQCSSWLLKNTPDFANLGNLRRLYEHQPDHRVEFFKYKDVQRVPMISVIANPDRFEKKVVSFYGILRKGPDCEPEINKRLSVYPSIEYVNSGMGDHSVEVSLNGFFKGIEKIPNNCSVEVIGVFSKEKPGFFSHPVGILKEASLRYYSWPAIRKKDIAVPDCLEFPVN